MLGEFSCNIEIEYFNYKILRSPKNKYKYVLAVLGAQSCMNKTGSHMEYATMHTIPRNRKSDLYVAKNIFFH